LQASASTRSSQVPTLSQAQTEFACGLRSSRTVFPCPPLPGTQQSGFISGTRIFRRVLMSNKCCMRKLQSAGSLMFPPSLLMEHSRCLDFKAGMWRKPRSPITWLQRTKQRWDVEVLRAEIPTPSALQRGPQCGGGMVALRDGRRWSTLPTSQQQRCGAGTGQCAPFRRTQCVLPTSRFDILERCPPFISCRGCNRGPLIRARLCCLAVDFRKMSTASRI